MKKYPNADAALKAVSKLKKNGQTYTPVQVYNSIQRSEAWARKSGNAVERAIWSKAKHEAELALQTAYAKAKKSGKHIPCDENCMGSFSDECDCHCGGVNHGTLTAVAV